MPNQVVLIPPKGRRRLSMSTYDNIYQKSGGNASPISLRTIDERPTAKLDSQNPMRINAPQPIWDSSIEWDDDDQQHARFRHRSFSFRHRRKQYEKPVPVPTVKTDDDDQSTYAVVSAVVSAPIVKLPNEYRQSDSLDMIAASKRKESTDTNENQGQTLLHLAAILGHEEIMRILVGEVSHMNNLINGRGQTPLLSAIEAGSTSAATFLMSQDPITLTGRDHNGSSVFHYATEFCNDIVLIRAISLLKRLNSGTARFIVSHLVSDKRSI